MRTSATNRRLRVLLTALRDRKLIPRPEFQRRLVWVNKHKVALIDTVLRDYPFPEIYVAAGDVDSETGEGTEILVDGQQRIDTLYQYFTGSPELRLGDVTPYAQLSQEKKIEFLEYEVVVRDLGNTDPDTIKDVFLRVNSTNYAANAMEVRNARFMGEFKTFGEELSEHEFFDKNKIFSVADVRRMRDLNYVLVLAVTIMSTYFNRDDALEDYLTRYNDTFDAKDDTKREIDYVLRLVEQCQFDSRSRVWKKADLFTLLVELHRLLLREKRQLSHEEMSHYMNEFYSLVDLPDESAPIIDDWKRKLADYRKASIQATNDRSSRILRGEIVRSVLEGQLAKAKYQ